MLTFTPVKFLSIAHLPQICIESIEKLHNVSQAGTLQVFPDTESGAK
ncbi:hypothetical protein ACFE35_23605 [Phormidesmis priestleyi ANT.L61.2]